MNSPLKNKRVYFITSDAFPEMTADDLLAATVLREAGAIVSPAIWTDRSIRWQDSDAIIIRSPWDYHLQPDRFLELLNVIEAGNARVFNSVDVIRWNMNKRYLLELQSKGITIPRTCFVDRSGRLDITKIRSVIGGGEVVVKPEISASAWNTRRYVLETLNKQDEEDIGRLLGTTNLVIQEFLPEVISEGEWSMVFFGDQFSHAVRKFPAAKDFRVQEEFGGTHRHEEGPPEILISQAKEAIAACTGELLYARVDGILRDDTFIIMEVELIEPALYFGADPESAGRFCTRLAEFISEGR